MNAKSSPVILSRGTPQQKKRPVCVYDWQQGALRTPGGQSYQLTPQGPLSAILARLGGIFDAGSTITLYVCTDTSASSAPPHPWYKEPAGDGWTVLYRRESDPSRRTGTYVRAGSPRIDVRHTAAWFGDANPGPDAMVEALCSLEKQLALGWTGRGRALLLATPAQTGLDLLEKCLPFDTVMPVLDLETRNLIHRTSTQGRIELYEPPSPDLEIAEFFEYDQVFAYGARLGKLPMPYSPGEPVRLEHYNPIKTGLPDAELWRPARYRCVWQVPHGWAHVGLLPEFLGDWQWPAEPGTWHSGWITHHELAFAQSQRWNVHIHEALLFGMPDGKRRWDILREWRERLLELWRLYAVWESDGDAIAGLCKSAIRAMVLGAIGSWHRTTGRTTVVVPMGQPLPPLDDMLEPPRMTADGLEYVAKQPVHKSMQKWQRPEWSSSIWSSQRVELTAELLTIPHHRLIGCNTDGYYSTAARPNKASGYHGAYRPGYWRSKGWTALPNGIYWPTSAGELLELRLLARGA